MTSVESDESNSDPDSDVETCSCIEFQTENSIIDETEQNSIIDEVSMAMTLYSVHVDVEKAGYALS